jgi:hypothetical protein
MASKLSAQWQRYFHSSRLVRYHSPALVLQLFKTVVLGSTNYLLALANPSAAAASALNVATLKALRLALRLGPSSPNSLVWAEGRAPRGEAIMARERRRFAIKMRTTPFRDTDIAPRIFRAMSATFHEGSNVNSRVCSLTHRILQLERNYEAQGIPAVVTPFVGRSREAAAYGRRVGLHHWILEGREEATGHAPTVDPLRPPPAPPSAVAAYFNGNYDTLVSDGGDNKFTTRLGVRGPGCSGAILAQVNRLSFSQPLLILAAVRAGTAGMFAAPLAAPGRLASDYAAAAKGAPETSGSKRARKRAALSRHIQDSLHCDDPCPNCGDATADPYHVLVECRHAAVVTARTAFTAQLPGRLERLVLHALLPRQTLQRLTFLGRDAEIARLRQVAADVCALASRTSWQSPDGRYSLYHLLAVATWSRRAVARQDLYLSRALAAVFSTCEMKNHHVRPLANYWASWASQGIQTIFNAWNSTSLASTLVSPALMFVSAVPAVAMTRRDEAAATAPRRSGRARKPSRRQAEANDGPVELLPSVIDFDECSDLDR